MCFFKLTRMNIIAEPATWPIRADMQNEGLQWPSNNYAVDVDKQTGITYMQQY